MTQEREKTEDIRSIPPQRCCGCAACANACPKNAISMEEGAEGFVFPKLDPDTCISCGLCLKACPVSEDALNNPIPNKKTPAAYAAASVDEIRLTSSSGGIFRVLALDVLTDGGSVYGAAWQKDQSVAHIRVTEPDELPALSGSKYVQSSIGTVYRQVKQDLKAGRRVLFSGTPCQNAGLRRFLKKEEDKLLCVDIVCHGVPSDRMLQTYLKETYGENQVDHMTFRTKEHGQTCTNGLITLKDGSKKEITPAGDAYERGFHKNIFLRYSCEACPFAAPPRPGDISLGDFWGLERYKPELTNPKGVSVVLVNSEKGAAVWNRLSEKLVLCEEVPLKAAIKYNRFRGRVKKNELRERFFRLYPVLGLEKAVNYTYENRYDAAFAYEGELDRAALEAELETEANRLGRTVCLEGHPGAESDQKVSGLDALLKGRMPSQLSEKEKKALEKLILAEPTRAELAKQTAAKAKKKLVNEMKRRVPAGVKERLKRLLE